MNPKISVVTVCYNAVNDIERTILSVINQTYPNIEYIIIDGGSKDGTMDVVNRYKDNIDVIVSEPDKGIYDAMNKGIDRATGDFVQFLNAGDVLYNEHVFDKLFAKGIDDGIDVVYGDIIYVMSFGTFYKIPEAIEKFNVTFPITHPASFVRRKVFDTLKFNINLKIAADFAFLKQVYDNGGAFYYIPNVPIVYFDGISGVSSKNVYQAWYDFNLVLGNNTKNGWAVKCFFKKGSIVIKNRLYKLLEIFCKSFYCKFCINKQLKNKTFKLIS